MNERERERERERARGGRERESKCLITSIFHALKTCFPGLWVTFVQHCGRLSVSPSVCLFVCLSMSESLS